MEQARGPAGAGAERRAAGATADTAASARRHGRAERPNDSDAGGGPTGPQSQSSAVSPAKKRWNGTGYPDARGPGSQPVPEWSVPGRIGHSRPHAFVGRVSTVRRAAWFADSRRQ